MRLIDADKLKEAFPSRHNNKFVLIADVRAAINQAPEVDAVPVIRCRDCVYKPCKMMPYSYDNDFCSYAERREAKP